MLTDYIQSAMNEARYEILPDTNTYYGEIEKCKGVWAESDTLEGCRRELQEVLEGWLILKIKDGDEIPAINTAEIKYKVA
ncbi:MAG: type II toxin-antitoxin system HicB family antitoxin [Bacteroidia bacterium]|nr:type II toxin-antitoxin system HicB family antitoxin [Bacteroidia bacterium]